MSDLYAFSVVESEMIYEPESESRYSVKETVIEYTSDLEKAVETVDELNAMNALRAYYIEQIELDESTHQIYGYNFNLINNRLFKTRIFPTREC